MKIIILKYFFFLLILLTLPYKVHANPALEVYMNDFYSKSNEASLILKKLETTLKDGSRKKVCLRQREAARLGLLANKSLIKAFEVAGKSPPMESIKRSTRRWESMLSEC